MSAFWDGLAAANDAAIETMGERVSFGGVELQAVVNAQFSEEVKSQGGRRELVQATVLVPGGTVLADAMVVSFRGVQGKIASWEPLGPDGHLQVNVGPFNRWSGEIPGL